MQISVDIWALPDKMLRDDPNLFIDFWSSTRCLWNKLLANANQLLCRKYQRRFFFEEVTFDHVPGKEKDQVSPMFISEHQRKTSLCRFWYIIIAISLSWLVLVIGFNNNSVNTVSFSIYLPFYVIFIKKWQKIRDCNFEHRAPIMEGCWRTSASGCCKSWRGSCGHRS